MPINNFRHIFVRPKQPTLVRLSLSLFSKYPQSVKRKMQTHTHTSSLDHFVLLVFPCLLHLVQTFVVSQKQYQTGNRRAGWLFARFPMRFDIRSFDAKAERMPEVSEEVCVWMLGQSVYRWEQLEITMFIANLWDLCMHTPLMCLHCKMRYVLRNALKAQKKEG